MLATNISNYNYLKCSRQMLAIIMFWNAGDKYYQLENPEMLTTNVSNYHFQKCVRYMLAAIVSRNSSDNNYICNFWRAPQKYNHNFGCTPQKI